MTRREEEIYEEKVLRIAKEKDLLHGRIYFNDEIEIKEYGVYATFNGFIFGNHGIRIPVRTKKDAYKMVLIHPRRFKEFEEVRL